MKSVNSLALFTLMAIFLIFLALYAYNTQSTKMDLKSPAFGNNGKIPSRHTCDGENIIPELIISGVPSEAKSIALIMDDPDIPESVKQSRGIDVFDHWVVFNIPVSTTKINEGEEPQGTQGKNGAGSLEYIGPCPPDKEHRYFFKLYALDKVLQLPEGSTKSEVENAMQGHILEQTELIGRYVRVARG